MKNIRIFLFETIFTSCTFLLLLGSCDKDDMDTNELCEFDCQIPDFNLDTFYLSKNSKSFMPYTGYEKIVFINENKKEAIFTPLGFPKHSFYPTPMEFICKAGNTIQYSIVREQLTVSHKCESINLEYYLNILNYPSFYKPLITDKLYLTFHEPTHDNLIDTTIGLNLVTDFRNNEACLYDEYKNYPDVNSTSSVTLLGRVFNNTYSVIQPTNLLPELYFNKEFGIVGFKDIKGVLWRFERFQ